ncbi:MAG: hypothetical protein IT249_05915 [Chitinophagaceae bacterium]|nr:hypothetical protein [Chitinophagaceae bacterium]
MNYRHIPPKKKKHRSTKTKSTKSENVLTQSSGKSWGEDIVTNIPQHILNEEQQKIIVNRQEQHTD